MFTGTSEGSVNTRAQCVLSQVLHGFGYKRDLHMMLLRTTAPPQLCSLRPAPIAQLGQLGRAGGKVALVLPAAAEAEGSGAGRGTEERASFWQRVEGEAGDPCPDQ